MAVDADRILRRLADRNDQIVSREQALAAGLSSGAIDRRIGELLVPVHRGVYRMHGADDTFARKIRAAAFAADAAQSVVFRRSAAALAGYPAVEPVVELAVSPARHLRIPGVVTVRTEGFADSVTKRKGLLYKDDAAVIIELAAVLSPDDLELALDFGLTKRHFQLDHVEHHLALLNPRRRQGIGHLRALIAERRPTGKALFMSSFELRLFRLFERSGLPLPKRQHRVKTASGTRFLDFAYSDEKVFIEAQSYEHHAGRAAWSADAVRGNDLAVLGWRRIDVTLHDLDTRPDQVVGWVRSAIASEA